MCRLLTAGYDQRGVTAGKILRPVFFEALWTDYSFRQRNPLALTIAIRTPAWRGIFFHPFFLKIFRGHAILVFLYYPGQFLACRKDNLSAGSEQNVTLPVN